MEGPEVCTGICKQSELNLDCDQICSDPFVSAEVHWKHYSCMQDCAGAQCNKQCAIEVMPRDNNQSVCYQICVTGQEGKVEGCSKYCVSDAQRVVDRFNKCQVAACGEWIDTPQCWYGCSKDVMSGKESNIQEVKRFIGSL